jgi:maleylpyruvate isomerase
VPEPALLPADPWLRGRARQIAETINAGTQPLQNGAVLRRLSGHGVDSRAWAAHFIGRGLHAVERLVSDTAGRFCIGDGPSLADIYVVPQLFNARLYGVSFDGLERLLAIETACMQLEAFQAAHPDQQPDAPARG